MMTEEGKLLYEQALEASQDLSEKRENDLDYFL